MNVIQLEKLLQRTSEIRTASGCTEDIKNAADLGSGSGDLAVKLAQRHINVTALDVSSVAIQKAKERISAAGAENISLVEADLNEEFAWKSLPEHADLVFAKLVVAFITDKAEFFRRIKLMIAKCGIFVLITPVKFENRDYSKRLAGISVPAEETEQLLKDNFKVVELFAEEHFEENGLLRTYICQG